LLQDINHNLAGRLIFLRTRDPSATDESSAPSTPNVLNLSKKIFVATRTGPSGRLHFSNDLVRPALQASGTRSAWRSDMKPVPSKYQDNLSVPSFVSCHSTRPTAFENVSTRSVPRRLHNVLIKEMVNRSLEKLLDIDRLAIKTARIQRLVEADVRPLVGYRDEDTRSDKT
jgi:hypothetical protein